MKLYTIIWDFDGTILPSDPYDSEQTLLLYKVNRAGEKIPFFKRVVARAIIYADMKEWLAESFKKYYLWVLKGTRIEVLDRVAEDLAKKISEADRQTFFRLNGDGHNMMIISCGTLELIERILKLAGLGGCFKMISGNRFQFENDLIAGMDFDILNPADKIKTMNVQGIMPEQSIVIGDGYTDLPLLDWAGISVLVDRTGEKKEKYSKKDYHFISSIPELVEIINPGISGTEVAAAT
jgi:phosphoserine phosphatase